MTANKHVKRVVRARARATGESYTAALRHLRRSDLPENLMQWQRFDKPDFGYAIALPPGWEERPAQLKNSPWETARFVEDGDRRHDVTVFRLPLPPTFTTSSDVAAGTRTTLEGEGRDEFHLDEDVEIAGRAGTLLGSTMRDAGRVRVVHQYFVVEAGVSFCLACGTSIPDEDGPLFTAIARRFELLSPPVPEASSS